MLQGGTGPINTLTVPYPPSPPTPHPSSQNLLLLTILEHHYNSGLNLGEKFGELTRDPETNSQEKAPKNGWLEDDPFLLGKLIFRGEMLVSGMVNFGWC